MIKLFGGYFRIYVKKYIREFLFQTKYKIAADCNCTWIAFTVNDKIFRAFHSVTIFGVRVAESQ